MKFRFQRSYLTWGLATTLLAVVILAPLGFSIPAHAEKGGTPPAATTNRETVAASLYNPGFDNHVWHWFSYVPGANDSFVPDGWSIWYRNGTVPFYTRVTTKHVDGEEAVRGHAYWDDGKLKAGLYQVIEGTIPCLTYQFGMYGNSQASEEDDILHALKVGIHQTGYSPSNVAVHEEFDEITWGGPCANCIRNWERVTVSTEALADRITVFTFANASGGSSHDIIWDAGYFAEVTPDLISDPDSPPASGGISGLQVATSSTSAVVSWNTSSAAISQVYYRLVAGPSSPVSPPGTLLLHTIYLPLVNRAPNPYPWFSTELYKSSETDHSVEISGLQPGSTYEYFVASRGVSGDACVTWVSDKGATFKTEISH